MLTTQSKLFVTGATGFLGSHIVQSLIAAGYQNILCLKRAESRMDLTESFRDKVSWIEGDILDVCFLEDVLTNVDCVIHAAAVVTFSTTNKKKLLQVAIDGTANLVNLSLDLKISKFIHISSVAAIGRKKPIEDIDEKAIFSHSQYDTTYGLSKFLAEQEVWRGHAEGLNVTILNPSMIIGMGRWDESSVQIFKKVYKGMPYYPSGTTGWVDVKDVSNAAVKVISENYNGERFIISAENIPYKEVMGQIATQLHVTPPQKALSPSLYGIAWRIEAIKSFFTGKPPVITRETIYSTSAQSYYDNRKSVSILGLIYTPIQETVTRVSTKFLSEIKGMN